MKDRKIDQEVLKCTNVRRSDHLSTIAAIPHVFHGLLSCYSLCFGVHVSVLS